MDFKYLGCLWILKNTYQDDVELARGGMMNKYVSVVILFLFVISAGYCLDGKANCVERDALSLQDFQVAKIKTTHTISLLQPWSEAISTLGNPGKVTTHRQSESGDSDWDRIYYEYEGIAISHPRYSAKVHVVIVTGKNYETCRGIRIGDDRKSIFDKYGQKYLWKDSRKNILTYYVVNTDGVLDVYTGPNYDPVFSELYALEFEIDSKGKVAKIVIYKPIGD